MLNKSLLGLVLVATTFTHCATDQAAKIRDAKSATVGIWGGAYRPNSKVGVVADLGGLVSNETNTRHVDDKGNLKNGKGKELASQNIKTSEEQRLDIGLHLYPMPTSAFFYGLGAERKNENITMDAHTNDSSLVAPQYANVEIHDQVISVGPSVGWDWIWPNGVSVLTDFGPRWVVSKNRVYGTNGDEQNVNKEKRDQLIRHNDNLNGFELISGRLIVGYSF